MSSACINCGSRAVHNHHVLYRQWSYELPDGADINDPDNLVPVCMTCHGRQHSGLARIPVARLPAVAVEFAHRNGMTHRIDRYYAQEETNGD